jgi:Na+-transporting methylmalonyl-CoA/oxaloacetate decarboxylase gamma subunit
VSSRQTTFFVVQGTLIGAAVLCLLAVVVYFFGDTVRSHLFPIDRGTDTSASSAPTLYYRDRGDGTVMVMEIGPGGTRIKGTINRADVPLLQADKVRTGWGESAAGPNSRVNALGSAFR